MTCIIELFNGGIFERFASQFTKTCAQRVSLPLSLEIGGRLQVNLKIKIVSCDKEPALQWENRQDGVVKEPIASEVYNNMPDHGVQCFNSYSTLKM